MTNAPISDPQRTMLEAATRQLETIGELLAVEALKDVPGIDYGREAVFEAHDILRRMLEQPQFGRAAATSA